MQQMLPNHLCGLAYIVVCKFLCSVVAGQLYPAYSSYKAIKNENSAQYHRWLTYWIVNAFVSGGLLVSDTFLWWCVLLREPSLSGVCPNANTRPRNSCRLPFYNEAKITCYLWLASPYTEVCEC
jgi:receptor expression-enhancing protein 1/2/3/4